MLKARGRGSTFNPPNRFDTQHFEPVVFDDPELEPGAGSPEDESLRTTYLRDGSRTILSKNDSPDIPFRYSINPYRGCEHGCVYCYARPTHEFLGFSAGLDFETRILVKTDAPELLRAELSRARWKPQLIAMSGVTDPYQPVERRLALSRRCLEVLHDFRNPVGIVTKSHLVTRDVDLLGEMAAYEGVSVAVSVTSLNARLASVMEPRASRPSHRLHTVHRLAEAGVPVGVMVAPVIPGLTDEELPSILEAAANAGATFASYVVLRLPYAVKDLFSDWLERHFPDRKDKVLNRVRSLREGRLNDPAFGRRMRGGGPFAQQIADLFRIGRIRAGLPKAGPSLSAAAFRRPGARQLALF